MPMSTQKMMLCVLVTAGLGLAGCGGDETSPTNPGATTLNLDSATAEEFTLEALGVVNDIVAAVPGFANGSFETFAVADQPLVKAVGDTVAWDPDQQAWVFAFDGPLFELEPPNTWSMSVDLWVQYRNIQGPLQYPLGATEMQVRYGVGMVVHQVDEQGQFDLDYATDTDLTVSFLGQETYGVAGSGGADVTMSQVGPQGSQAGTFGMDWTVDVTTAAGGCPSGTATVTSQAYTMTATYDGQGGVMWTLVGPNYQSTGSDTVPCGPPVN